MNYLKSEFCEEICARKNCFNFYSTTLSLHSDSNKVLYLSHSVPRNNTRYFVKLEIGIDKKRTLHFNFIFQEITEFASLSTSCIFLAYNIIVIWGIENICNDANIL